MRLSFAVTENQVLTFVCCLVLCSSVQSASVLGKNAPEASCLCVEGSSVWFVFSFLASSASAVFFFRCGHDLCGFHEDRSHSPEQPHSNNTCHCGC